MNAIPRPAHRPSAPVTVRRACPGDSTTVFDMLVELARHEKSLDAVDLDEARLAGLIARPDVIVLIADVDGEPAGYVSAARQVKFWTGGEITALDDLFVREGSRDRGIGETLMRRLAEVTADDTPIIRWETDPENHAGRRFYERLGATIRTKLVASWAPATRKSGEPGRS